MALKGIKVIEMAGLAPAPFCGMILADFGASVTRVDRTPTKGKRFAYSVDTLSRGKRSIAIDLKQYEGVDVLRKLCAKADVIIEPFRKGVMEKLGLGPEILMSDNPGLIYARLTGFGQKGPLAQKAGHDINYISISGILSQLGRKHDNPYPPINLLADFAGGGLMCAMGVALALYERTCSGRGQVIDANMVNGSAYLSTFLWTSRDLPVWPGKRGENHLDGGSGFYGTYKTKDAKYVAIGPLEPQFYAALLEGLGLSKDEMPQHTDTEIMEKRFQEIFLTKTREEWVTIFEGLDACFTPILEMDEATRNEHNIINEIFLSNVEGSKMEPAPAPKLSRTPGVSCLPSRPMVGEHSSLVLLENELSKDSIKKLIESGVVFQNANTKSSL